MQPKTLKSLNDIRIACEKSARFTNGLSFEDYDRDDLVQSGVERNFEFVGASNRRNQRQRITSWTTERSLAFGTSSPMDTTIDNKRVWFVVTVALPLLHAEIAQLLETT